VIVCGKSAPDTVTTADLEAHSAIVEQLLASGALTEITAAKTNQPTKTSEE